MGIFSGFLNDHVDLYGVEPLGRGSKIGDRGQPDIRRRRRMHSFNNIMLKDESVSPPPFIQWPRIGLPVLDPNTLSCMTWAELNTVRQGTMKQ